MTDSVGKSNFKLERESQKKNYSVFFPGFCFGLLAHKVSKSLITREHVAARPLSGILFGIFYGGLLHYYNWRKRVSLENACINEELIEQRDFERNIKKFKAGQEIENAVILNYLKNIDKI